MCSLTFQKCPHRVGCETTMILPFFSTLNRDADFELILKGTLWDLKTLKYVRRSSLRRPIIPHCMSWEKTAEIGRHSSAASQTRQPGGLSSGGDFPG